MSDRGYVGTLLNTLDPAIKTPLVRAFEHVMDLFKLGSGTKATNAAWYRLTATTPSTANTEFSIVHGLDVAPALLIPVLDLGSTGNAVVPLTVTRVPDAKRVYLASSSTSAAITVYVEA